MSLENAAANAAPIPVDLPAREVLLTEDRALVTRRGPVSLPGGPATLRLEGLSPALVNASVQVALRGLPGASTGHVAVTRRWVPLARPTERSTDALAREALAAKDRLEDLDAAIARAQRRGESVLAELQRYAALVARNAGRGLFEAGRLDVELRRLRERLLEVPARVAALRGERVDLRRALADLQAMIAAVEQGALRLETTLELAVDAPAGQAELELRYLVPNALWRPSYEAALSSGPEPRVVWRVQGMVWQRTGEDWRGVRVTLSTARPSAGTALPPLPLDRLSVRPKTPEERRTIQADFRDQLIQTTELAAGQPEALPGVDDGGETRVLRAAAPVDLPSDGRPHRVHVSAFEAPARARWLCVPERETAVVRELSLENRAAEPLLAGPVVLVLDGAYVGVGDIPFVSPGERFALSFGSSDDVVVEHTRRRSVEKRKLQSDLTWFVCETTLHHTGGAPLDLEVVGRLPVSELEKVQVLRAPPPLTSPGAEGPDEHGHVRWRVRLQPGGREVLSLAFRLDVGGGVQIPEPW